ncbi:MAG: hypothetical protein AB7Q37_05705 [Pyrinomonadaceae bacterium]
MIAHDLGKCANPKRLKLALAELVRFLKRTNTKFWPTQLDHIAALLNDPETIEEGRLKLDDCFGGMGSLNDLLFTELNGNLPPGHSEEEVNRELDLLLNRVFRENRLASKGWWDRLLWRFYEFKYRNELPPRIKKAFAK